MIQWMKIFLYYFNDSCQNVTTSVVWILNCNRDILSDKCLCWYIKRSTFFQKNLNCRIQSLYTYDDSCCIYMHDWCTIWLCQEDELHGQINLSIFCHVMSRKYTCLGVWWSYDFFKETHLSIDAHCCISSFLYNP